MKTIDLRREKNSAEKKPFTIINFKNGCFFCSQLLFKHLTWTQLNSFFCLLFSNDRIIAFWTNNGCLDIDLYEHFQFEKKQTVFSCLEIHHHISIFFIQMDCGGGKKKKTGILFIKTKWTEAKYIDAFTFFRIYQFIHQVILTLFDFILI